MKKKLSVFPFVLIGLSVPILLGVSSCNRNNNASSEEDTSVNFNVGFMQHLAADLNGVTGLTIANSSSVTNSHSNKTLKKYHANENPDNIPDEANTMYLYKTFQDIIDGNTTIENEYLSKVEFTKSTEVTEDVYDGEGNLITTETIITQESIPAKLHKALVSRGFTFLQYVPNVPRADNYNIVLENGEIVSRYIDVRPDHRFLDYDSRGIAEFDKISYYTNDVRKNFVIDNKSGNVYKLEGFDIHRIFEGVIEGEDGLLYDMEINAQNELVFSTLFQNTTIKVNNYFKDKYGTVFVENDSVDIIDYENGLVMYTNKYDYHFSDEGVVIFANVAGEDISNIKKIDENIQQVAIEQTDVFNFKHAYAVDYQISDFGYKWQIIREGKLYTADFQYAANTYFLMYDLNTGAIEKRFSFGRYSGSGTGWNSNTIRSLVLSYDKVLLWSDLIDKNGALYWAQLYGEDASFSTDINNYDDDHIELIFANAHLLMNDVKTVYRDITNRTEEWIWGEHYEQLTVKKVTLADTISYKIQLNDENIPELLLESEYIAASQNVVTIQPL